MPLLGVLVGLLLYGGLRLTGAFGTLGDVAPRRESGGGWRERTRGMSLRERAEEIPRGCLISVIAAAAVWCLGWIVVLGIGLDLLS